MSYLAVVQFSHLAVGLVNFLSVLSLEESPSPSQFAALLDAQFPAVLVVMALAEVSFSLFLLLLQNDCLKAQLHTFVLTIAASAAVAEDLASKRMMMMRRFGLLYHAVSAEVSMVWVFLRLEDLA